jgi:geranylgeranyl pyrophosphate synthase
VTPAGASFAAFARQWRPRIEAALEQLVPAADEPPVRLHAAMRYALFPGGKRLRPLLGLLGCSASGGDCERAVVPCAAIECLHTYSLVHDDLPCMDDDTLRRGRPTCHVAFDEATALLAGDALLTLAFEGVARGGDGAVLTLARAAGSLGMVGGQMEDLAAEGHAAPKDLERVHWIHDRKTGALIAASLVIGAQAGAAPEAPPPAALVQQLLAYGQRLGRAFQITDDCLDLTGTAAELGKNPLADVAHEKLTWPAVLGLEPSLRAAQDLAAQCIAMVPAIVDATARWQQRPALELDAARELLQDAALFAVQRRN